MIGRAGGWIAPVLLASVVVLVAVVTRGSPDAEETQEEHWYPDDTHPSWSPDGEHVAFVSNRGPDRKRTVYELDVRTLDIKPLVPWDVGGGQPRYSPDGKRLVFSAGLKLYLLHRDTQQTQLLFGPTQTDPGNVAFDAHFEGSGALVFWRKPRRHGHNAVFRLALDPAGRKIDLQVLIKSDYDLLWPAPSPDGRQIAYVEIVDDALGSYRGGTTNICVYDCATGRSRVAFVSPYCVDSLSWFPDGVRLLVHARGATEVLPHRYVVDTKLGQRAGSDEWLRLASAAVDALEVSPDGQWVCFHRMGSTMSGFTLWRSRVDGTVVEELTHPPAWYYERFPDAKPVFGYSEYYGDRDPEERQ